MNDIFGKVYVFFLAAIVLFGMPLVYMNERAKTAQQLYLLTQATHFVDSVCNTGVIDRGMMQQLYGGINSENTVYRIQLLHESREYVYNEETGGYERCDTYRDEKDIWEQVEDDRDYYFDRGDFLRINIQKDAGFLLFPGREDRTVSVQYGGTVKYEAY